LLKARKIEDKKELTNTLILGAIFSAGAAVTKQSGVYVFGIFPILAYIIVLKDYQQMEYKKKIQFVLVTQLILFLIVVPWYVVTEINILNGLNKSEFNVNLVKPYRGMSFLDRGVEAFLSLGKYAVLYVFLMATVWFLRRQYQWVTVFLTIPLFLIWAFFLSYSYRNYSIAIPFLGMSAGLGAERILDLLYFISKKARIFRFKYYLFPAIIVFVLLGSGLLLTDDLILDHQITQQRNILDNGLNKKLYNYFAGGEPYSVIMTNYPIHFLPGFEDLQIQFSFETYDGYAYKLGQYPHLEFMLVPGRADKEILAEIEDNIEKGNFELIFTESKYQFIRIITKE
jgi:hypothetical protein